MAMRLKPSFVSNSVAATKPPPPLTLLRRLIDLDTALSLHIHTFCQPIIPRSILKALEISGDGRFWFPIPFALFLPTPPNLRPILLLLLIGFLLDLLLVGSLKFLVRRPRPLYNKGMHLTVSVDHWSFPSGHSSRVCFIAGFLYLSSAYVADAFRRSGSSEIAERLVLAVCVWSTATSMSRVLLGRHFVFDVIAGAFLGLFEAVFVFHVVNHCYPLIHSAPIFPYL